VWGGISILKDHLATLRPVAKPEPLIRFETEPGRFIGYLRVSFYIPLERVYDLIIGWTARAS
jgi:hypothetical protein